MGGGRGVVQGGYAGWAVCSMAVELISTTILSTYAQECGLPLPPSHVYVQLADITSSIRAGNLDAAIQWAESNRNFLSSRSSNLEFALHRSQFLRIATGEAAREGKRGGRSSPSAMALDSDASQGRHPAVTPFSTVHIQAAVEYGRIHFRRHLPTHLATIQALFSFSLFLPPLQPNRLPTIAELYEQVPYTYHHFLDAQQMHSPHLEPLFAIEYCARNAMSREAPLKIAVEVGVSGGALLKIHKARKVMKLRRNEWSQANELPVSTTIHWWRMGCTSRYLGQNQLTILPSSRPLAADRHPPPLVLPLPLHLHLPSQQRAGHRGESTDDDELWSRRLRRIPRTAGERTWVSKRRDACVALHCARQDC